MKRLEFQYTSIAVLARTWLYKKGQIWRMVTAQLIHANFAHILFNMISFAQIGSKMETELHSTQNLWFLTVINLIAGMANVCIAYLLDFCTPLLPVNLPLLAKECSIGFSAVLFGAMVLDAYVLSGPQQVSFFNVMSISRKTLPWFLLVLVQVLVPHASWLGHLSGILAGYICYVLFDRLKLSDDRISWVESLGWSRWIVSRSSWVSTSTITTEPLL